MSFFFKQYYHYTIYAIILIGVHRMAGTFTLYFSCHSQYSYYLDYFRLSIDYIAYLPTLWGKHHIFAITIQTCKCAILKAGLLWFDLSHQYLYKLHTFSFCEIWNSEQYRAIVDYSPTLGQQVSVRSYIYYPIQLLPWLFPPVNQLYRILVNIAGRASRLCDRHTNV